MTSFIRTDMLTNAAEYAAKLVDSGFESVQVWDYRVSLDNRSEWHKNHEMGFGYAVRYTSGASQDSLRSPRTGRKFHENSLSVFTSDDGLSQSKLIRAGWLADFGGVNVTPYYVGWWSPGTAEVETVGLKVIDPHTPGESGPLSFGPTTMYHAIMSLVTAR